MTPEAVYMKRQSMVAGGWFTGLGLAGALAGLGDTALAAIDGYPAPQNMAYRLTVISPRKGIPIRIFELGRRKYLSPHPEIGD